MPPPRQLAAVDPHDEAAMERVIRAAVAHLMRAPQLDASRLPPERRAWLEGFAYRSLEGAVLQGPHAARPFDLDELWSLFSGELVADGVVPTVVGLQQMALDGDGTDERRGWVSHPKATSRLFLADQADLRDLLKGVVETRSTREWTSHPGWFGVSEFPPAEIMSHFRTRALRWIGLSGEDTPWLRLFLDDDDRRLRHISAVRVAERATNGLDEHVRARLVEAVEDPDWIWSYRDHFAGGRRGAETAKSLLTQFSQVED